MAEDGLAEMEKKVYILEKSLGGMHFILCSFINALTIYIFPADGQWKVALLKKLEEIRESALKDKAKREQVCVGEHLTGQTFNMLICNLLFS